MISKGEYPSNIIKFLQIQLYQNNNVDQRKGKKKEKKAKNQQKASNSLDVDLLPLYQKEAEGRLLQLIDNALARFSTKMEVRLFVYLIICLLFLHYDVSSWIFSRRTQLYCPKPITTEKEWPSKFDWRRKLFLRVANNYSSLPNSNDESSDCLFCLALLR